MACKWLAYAWHKNGGTVLQAVHNSKRAAQRDVNSLVKMRKPLARDFDFHSEYRQAVRQHRERLTTAVVPFCGPRKKGKR